MSCGVENDEFGEKIARECFKLYDSLGRKGKPELNREWTNVACIVKTEGGAVRVVTLATGTKCIGENHRSNTGMLLNDSHAEVLARRLFLKYLYHHVKLAIQDPANSIFEKCQINNTYTLRPGIKFHLFSSDIPCGDASIFPKKQPQKIVVEDHKRKHIVEDEDLAQAHATKKIRTENDNKLIVKENWQLLSETEKPNEISKQELEDKEKLNQLSSSDIHRTGAKCVPGGTQDLLEPGENYHVTGALRIKPGRGDRTLSMSCSDKIMKWCHLGLQGGLLSNFLPEPIFLSSIILSVVECDRNAVRRAISGRGRTPSPWLKLNPPAVLHSNARFIDCKQCVEERNRLEKTGTGRLTPAGVSILWCGTCGVYEMTSHGRKHGVTKKHINTDKACTSICKKELFKDFMKIIRLRNPNEAESKSYRCWKLFNQSYKVNREEFFKAFSEWTKKPMEHENFSLEP